HRRAGRRGADLRLPHERAAAQGAGAEAVRGPEGLDQADQPGLDRRRPRHAGEDRRGQEPHDPQLRLLRGLRDRRPQFRGLHPRRGGRLGLTGTDPRPGPVTVPISGTSALLLARLAETTGGDGGAVLMRALGLLDLALKAKREGKRLAFYDPTRDEMAEVAF